MEDEGYGGIVPLGFYENQLLGSNGMPLGFRFHLTDQELISFFLYNRVLHRDYCENLIYEFDLFGKTPPWVVWENFGGPGLEDQDLYFFCQLTARSQARIKREIDAGGTWSESNSKPVKDLENEKAIGKKRNLRVFGGADDSDHEIRKVVLCRLKKNSRSGNKKNCSNSTQQARNKVGSQNTTSGFTHTIEELQNCPGTSSAPVLPFDESNYKMISDATDHDQQCISNIDGSSMPASFSDHDYVPRSLISEGGDGEEMFFDLDDLFAPLDCGSAWSQEKLPQIDETQLPLPLDGMTCWNDCLWMGNCVQ
ncbi:unnamed protein product [Malus baccata var. baccata]